jgi:ElaB/YqjD/DUF883 family membrane-anchored ribosome-binding protein
VDRELEMIHGEMEGTRKSLADKLGEVESIIQEKVKEAGDSVTSIVDNVKEFGSSVTESVSSAKETLKETFNIRKQIEDHPWAAVGAAVAVGVAGGIFLGPSGSHGASAASSGPSYSPPPSPSYAAAAKGASSVVTSLLHNLQGLAVGSLMSFAQDLVNQNAPPAWKDSLTGMVDDLCVQLTGEKPSHFVDKSAEASPKEETTSEPSSAWTGQGTPGNRVHNSGTRI